jgi:hypothetical protein
MARVTIPKKTSEALLAEYSHRCAICGGDHPHLHHIDEDHANSELLNLLPLCPNCHLRDQHNPTRKVDIRKLHLFRKFKDPAILKPQFQPLFTRQLFLAGIEDSDSSVSELRKQVNELIEFVATLEMGEFYSKRLRELLGSPHRAYMISLGGGYDTEYGRAVRQSNRELRTKLRANAEAAVAFLVEQLRYQRWANEA